MRITSVYFSWVGPVLYHSSFRRTVKDKIHRPDLIGSTGTAKGHSLRGEDFLTLASFDLQPGCGVEALNTLMIDPLTGLAQLQTESCQRRSGNADVPRQQCAHAMPHCGQGQGASAIHWHSQMTRSARRSLRPRDTMQRTTSRRDGVLTTFFSVSRE